MEKTTCQFSEAIFLGDEVKRNALFTPEDFQDEEELIAKTAEMFIKQDVTPQIEAIEKQQHEISVKLFEKAGELGLLAIEVPEDYDGLELNKKISGLVAERIGFGGSFSVSYNIHAGVGTLPYVYFGTEEQKKTYLPKIASGEWIGAYALTEPDAGSDALKPKTNAILSDDGTHYTINGEKQWITNANMADVYVVFAKTDNAMTAFIVERTYDGVSIGVEEMKMGIKGSSTATLILQDVKVPKENVLGELGQGHKVAMNILNMARLKLAFSNIGTAKQAMHLAVNYGKERKQFNHFLVDFTMIQEKIATMAVAIYGAESAAYRTAGDMDDAIEAATDQQAVMKSIANYAMECALNKVFCSESLAYAVDEAVQIHGGYGYMQEYDVERLYRDARISRIFEGTNEINRLTIAKMLTKRFDSGLDNSVVDHQADVNTQFVASAKLALQLALQHVTSAQIDINAEQEYSRALSDIVTQVYVMDSALARLKKQATPPELHTLLTDVLCEEGYHKVSQLATSIIAGIQDGEALNTSLASLPKAPTHRNLFAKKRAIATEIITNPKWFA